MEMFVVLSQGLTHWRALSTILCCPGEFQGNRTLLEGKLFTLISDGWLRDWDLVTILYTEDQSVYASYS